MNMWTNAARARERIIPVSRISPYARITSYAEHELDSEEYLQFAGPKNQSKSPNQDQSPQEYSYIEPPLTQYGRHAAQLVKAALEVADQAAKLLSLNSFTTEELKAFTLAVKNMVEHKEWNQVSLSYSEESQGDPAYLRSDKETIEYWEEKARIVLGISPLELMVDEQSFQPYSAYNEDKQKTWRFPHQGWVIQKYG